MPELRTLSIVYTADAGTTVDFVVEIVQWINERGFQIEAISDHKTQPATDFPQGLTE